jgi:uncharacterized membrane protein (DUF106 family)
MSKDCETKLVPWNVFVWVISIITILITILCGLFLAEQKENKEFREDISEIKVELKGVSTNVEWLVNREKDRFSVKWYSDTKNQ